MEKDIWLKKNFINKNIPDWNCPSCNKGILKIDKFKFSETAQSTSARSHQDWEPGWITYTFTGSLICNKCLEFVAFLGNGDEAEYEDYIDGEYAYISQSYFYPKYFYPYLQLFEVNENCPKDINKVINDSFALYWNDLSSCANKIRIALELLMDYYKINKTFKDRNNKRRPLSLHHRIVKFKIKNSEVSELLLAIKWIGNSGSHIGSLERVDIIETYEMLELSINKLFDDTEERIKKISKKINTRKGKIKR